VAKRRRQAKWEKVLAALEALGEGEDALRVLRKGLESERGLVVARAAHFVRERGLAELSAELADAARRLRDDGAKRDPGCLGKLAALDALDHLEHGEATPFIEMWDYTQLEPGHQRATDTATGVRVRCAAALARLSHPDTLLVLGTLLGDGDAAVRRGAVETLAYHGARDGAALVVHKLATGDEDPIVIAEAMSALLDLAPAWAKRVLSERLRGNADDRELAAMALGQHRSAEAIELLIAWYDELVLADARAQAIAAIGLHRSDRARAFLLELVATSSEPTARAALDALAMYRYDTRLRDDALAAARKSAHDGLLSHAERAFAAES
jgi:hypothetical protein